MRGMNASSAALVLLGKTALVPTEFVAHRAE